MSASMSQTDFFINSLPPNPFGFIIAWNGTPWQRDPDRAANFLSILTYIKTFCPEPVAFFGENVYNIHSCSKASRGLWLKVEARRGQNDPHKPVKLPVNMARPRSKSNRDAHPERGSSGGGDTARSEPSSWRVWGQRPGQSELPGKQQRNHRRDTLPCTKTRL